VCLEHIPQLIAIKEGRVESTNVCRKQFNTIDNSKPGRDSKFVEEERKSEQFKPKILWRIFSQNLAGRSALACSFMYNQRTEKEKQKMHNY